MPRLVRRLRPGARGLLFTLAFFIPLSGCSIHYFDAETGTEHIWGIGHMAMKPGGGADGLKAIAQRTDVVGISLGKLQEGTYAELGWGARQRISIFDANSRLCLAWPRGSFYTARIGAAFPTRMDDCGTTEGRPER